MCGGVLVQLPCSSSFWISPSMETLQPLWALCASHPPRKKVFPDCQREPPLVWFVSIASGPVAGQIKERTWLHLLHTLPSGVCTHWLDPSLTILFSKLSNPSSHSFLRGEMLQSLNYHSGPLLTLQ